VNAVNNENKCNISYYCIVSDIDECFNNTELCHQLCVNTLGSYQCACEQGFIYDSVNNVCCGKQNLSNFKSTLSN